MRFVSLASGSKGNCTLISSGQTNILVDCGITAKRADESLKALGLSLEDIRAVVLTHEHGDHIKGIKRLMAAYNIPVYGTEGTLKSLARAANDEYFNYAGHELMEPVTHDFQLEIGDISVIPFATYHDAAEPCGYRFEAWEGEKSVHAAVMTDCGHYDDYIADHLTELNALLLEANHDLKMLAQGPYPMVLKRRIMSQKGHMSNPDSGALLSKIFAPGLQAVLLGHLSMENNTHQLAMETVSEKFAELRGPEALSMLRMDVAPQNGISRVIDI